MRTLTLLTLALASLPALAQDGLQRCRALSDGAARLACYDALADAARTPAAPAPAAVPAATGPAARTASPVSVVAPAAAVTAASPPAAPTAPTAPAAATPARAGDAAFGLPEARRPDAVESVDSAVGPNFGGWGPNSRIRLANGQVWLVIDGSSVVLPERARKVSVKRGMLGSYYLDIEGLNTSPRVRRVE